MDLGPVKIDLSLNDHVILIFADNYFDRGFIVIYSLYVSFFFFNYYFFVFFVFLPLSHGFQLTKALMDEQ